MATLSMSVTITTSKKAPSSADYKAVFDWLADKQIEAAQIPNLKSSISARWPHGRSPTGDITLTYTKAEILVTDMDAIFAWVQTNILDAVPNNAGYSPPEWGWTP